MKRRTLLLGAGAAVTLAAAGGAWRLLQAPPSPAASLFALTLPDPDGTDQALAQWQGRPMVVNFWATWCAPCVKEMPDLNALQGEFESVQFVGIGVDRADNINRFIETVPVDYPLLVAPTAGMTLMRDLGNTQGGLPFTVILSPRGDMVRSILGQVERDDLRRTLAALTA